jgi:hypothetical protein
MILYHGGTDIVTKPVIMPQSGGRDFGIGFYCTDIHSQAGKWAKRQGRVRKLTPVLNIYEFDLDNAQRNLNCKLFDDYSIEWLELVINCRKNPHYVHGYDIVYGRVANDDVGETVQAVVDGLMPLDFAMQKLIFMPSNNQYCFCSEKSCACLEFIESQKQE